MPLCVRILGVLRGCCCVLPAAASQLASQHELVRWCAVKVAYPLHVHVLTLCQYGHGASHCRSSPQRVADAVLLRQHDCHTGKRTRWSLSISACGRRPSRTAARLPSQFLSTTQWCRTLRGKCDNVSTALRKPSPLPATFPLHARTHTHARARIYPKCAFLIILASGVFSPKDSQSTHVTLR